MQTEASRVQGELYKSSPYSKFQYVTVTFGTANSDLDVPHDLNPNDPEGVDYEVVRADRACKVYDKQSGTRRAWASNYIVLRCDTAFAVVQLRLSLRRA
jgi:hypothetical protein